MKISTFILSVVLSCLSISAFSQFAIGDRLVGGAVNVYSGSSNSWSPGYPNNNNNNFNSSLTPRYSWVPKNNIMNGIFLSAGYNHSKSVGGNPESYQYYDIYNLGLGYFIRNFKDFSQQFGWFMEYNAMLGYNWTNQKFSNPVNSTTNSYSNFSGTVNVMPGLYYKLSPKAVIEAGFGGIGATYARGKSGESKSNSFNVGLNFPSNFTFGMQFQLGNKQNKQQ